MPTRAFFCATCYALLCTAQPLAAATVSINKDNVENWGLMAGYASVAVRVCNANTGDSFRMVFAWSRGKYGTEYDKLFKQGAAHMDELLTKRGADVVCKLASDLMGPKGSQAENMIVPTSGDKIISLSAGTDAREKAQLDTMKISASQFLDRVGKNEIRFRKEVTNNGGRLLLTGKVISVEDGFLGTGPMITLAAGSEWRQVIAYLDSSQKTAAEDIDAGQMIALACTNPTNVLKDFSAAAYECTFVK